MTSIQKLLNVSSESICGKPYSKVWPDYCNDLKFLFENKNGFFAFEQSLHVFPTVESNSSYDIEDWNSHDLWKKEYTDLTDDLYFFAEDIFGVQFCFNKNDSKIYTFNPETGLIEFLANNLEEWARLILGDYNYLTGCKIAHEWQEKNGKFKNKTRLIPNKLFVFGGEYSIDNLSEKDAIFGMKARGQILQKIKNMPDGTNVQFKLID